MCHWFIGQQHYTAELSYADIPFVICITSAYVTYDNPLSDTGNRAIIRFPFDLTHKSSHLDRSKPEKNVIGLQQAYITLARFNDGARLSESSSSL